MVCAVEYWNGEGVLQAIDYPVYHPAGNDYEKIEFSFKPRADLTPLLVCQLWNGWTGKVWFDDVKVTSAGADVSLLLTKPTALTFLPGSGKVAFQTAPVMPRPALVYAELEQPGQPVRKLVLRENGSFGFAGDFGELKPGKGVIRARVLDVKAKKSLFAAEYPVTVLTEEQVAAAPKGAARFDEYGRLIVDGKPFMPVGVFGLSGDSDFDRLSKAGFNCLQLYASLHVYAKDQSTQAENMRKMLDRMNERNVKLLFSMAGQYAGRGEKVKSWGGVSGLDESVLHAVKTLKDHPALLGWYVSDEVARAGLGDVIRRREAVNALDPWHPTWTLTYRTEDLPLYGMSGDVIGVDPYPIKSDPKAVQSLDVTIQQMTAAKTTGMPIWATPQIFNWNFYEANATAETLAKTREPNAEELRAQPLLCAILGAKGFIFYGYTCLYHHAPYKFKLTGYGDRRWPAIAAMATELRSIEPYIMSAEPRPEVTVKSVSGGRVMAGAFTANGRRCLVIVSLDDKPAVAEITWTGAAGLKSRHGRTAESAPGVYRYQSKAIESDILEK